MEKVGLRERTRNEEEEEEELIVVRKEEMSRGIKRENKE